ncbi:MAG TPA: hypothetical protein VGG39_23915 [Polyangiaceae bacterium]|jgi:hypothetical protein
MRQNIIGVPALFLVATLAVACGGKVEDPLGHGSSDQGTASGSGASGGSSNSGGSSAGSSSSSSPSTSSCASASQMGGGGGGVAGGPCTEVFESAICGATTYTVNCTCPGPCDCVVNGQTVDTAPTTSCSDPTCGTPDDAWKACGFPTVPGMP